MPDPPICDLEEAEAALERVKPEIESLGEGGLSAHNVDLAVAASMALSAAISLAGYRDRIARIDEFDIKNVDRLADYAKATWYLHVTNLPVDDRDTGLEGEVEPLRARLLSFAEPLAQMGEFDRATIKKLRKSRGLKQRAGDLVALAALYRAGWERVRNHCGVTEADLDRAALVGIAVFEEASRRESASRTPRESTLLVRKAWTLLDRAYTQCRRVITFIRYLEGDYDELVPSFRRNAGNAGKGRKGASPRSGDGVHLNAGDHEIAPLGG